MIRIEIPRLRIKPIIAAIGGSIFACAIAVPAFSLSTAPVLTPRAQAYATAVDYDHSAPLAGVQLAGGEGEHYRGDYQQHSYRNEYGGDENQPYYGDEGEHARHEEEEQQDRLHRYGEEGEQYAQRLRNRAEGEHAEHEMREHNNYNEGYGNEGYRHYQENNPNYQGYAPDND